MRLCPLALSCSVAGWLLLLPVAALPQPATAQLTQSSGFSQSAPSSQSSQSSPPAQTSQNAQIAERVRAYVEEQTRGLPGEVQITVKPLDPRTRLSDCNDLQMFLPPGTRLWGQASVGVRCIKPLAWQIFVPAVVRVSGSVVVANRPLTAGTVIDPGDVGVRIEELTALPATVLLEPAQAIGRVLSSGVNAGAALRADNIKQPLAVVQGQTVRVIYESATITVSADGRALGNATVGQGVEVRVGSGKTVRGIARETGVVVVK